MIEQAKGIIAQGAKISVDDAFTLLRAYARNHNCRLRQTACDVIDGTLSTNTLTAPAVAPARKGLRSSWVPISGIPRHMEYRTAFDVVARLAPAGASSRPKPVQPR